MDRCVCVVRSGRSYAFQDEAFVWLAPHTQPALASVDDWRHCFGHDSPDYRAKMHHVREKNSDLPLVHGQTHVSRLLYANLWLVNAMACAEKHHETKRIIPEVSFFVAKICNTCN
jgi:hypothetical protein